MASRPQNLSSRDPGVLAPSFTAHRAATSKDRNLPAWRVQTRATLDSAVIGARPSAATVRRWQRGAEELLASTGRRADLGETADPSASPAAHRSQEENSRWRVPGIPTWVGYAGRLITVGLTVLSIHLAVLLWILLPIGG
jgi:hypothetical protein